jgi:hypothetical protein
MNTVNAILKDVLNAAYLDEKNKEYTNILFNHALKMEREQTLDFTRNAVRKILDEDRQNPFNLEQYYNETYGVKGRENKTVVEEQGEWGDYI